MAERALGHRVLDAGCGTGLHATLLASEGHDVTGIDVADAAIQRARLRPVAGGGSARFLAADIFDLPKLEM